MRRIITFRCKKRKEEEKLYSYGKHVVMRHSPAEAEQHRRSFLALKRFTEFEDIHSKAAAEEKDHSSDAL